MTTENRVIITVVVIVVIVGAFFGFRYYTNKDNKKVTGGRQPSADDIACATGGARVIVGSCTKPVIDPKNMPKSMKQKCFTSAELGLNEGDSGPDKVTENGGLGTTWYYNFQSGDNFCYRSPQWIK